jgi:hypothetical protein
MKLLREENTELKTRLMNAMESMEMLAREVADLKHIKTAAMDLVRSKEIGPLFHLSSIIDTYISMFFLILIFFLRSCCSCQLATERIRNKELEEELNECRRELSESYRATVILKYDLLHILLNSLPFRSNCRFWLRRNAIETFRPKIQS